MDNIKVSICCVTYNHEKYIKDAIEGFLSQKTDFDYEIIIHDDASTDRTADIVRQYETKYPDKIHGIYQEENQYSKHIGTSIGKAYVHPMCRGKYIASCEGDDFWIDCNKLQIQVDYMESHPECSLYLHNGLRINSGDLSIEALNPYNCDNEKDISPAELITLYNNHPPTASLLYKRELTDGADYIWKSTGVDQAMRLYALTIGSVHYNSRIMSVYRFAVKGSCTEKICENGQYTFNSYLGMICFFFQFDKYTNHRYHIWITEEIYKNVRWFLYAFKSNIILAEKYNEYKEQWDSYPLLREKCIKNLDVLKRQMFDEAYCSDKVKLFINQYENIVVMGIGQYSLKLTRQLKSNDIDFTGYAISHKQEKDKDYFMDKPVWELSSLPFDKEKTGVLIAIKPERWDDIAHSLETAGISNYYCPFLLDEIEIY